jgi:chromosome segregation ATPase
MEITDLKDALEHANGDLRHLTNVKIELEDALAIAQRAEAAAVADKARAASDARAAATEAGQSVAAAVNLRAAEAERRAAALEAELQSAARQAGRTAAVASEATEDVQALYEEKLRLEAALARAEAEVVELRRQITRLQAEATALRTAAASSAANPTPTDADELRQALEKSEAKRVMVENDFRDLVAGIQLSGDGAEDDTEAAAELLASKLDKLQEEKLALQTNLASCEAVCTQMQGELQRMQREYDELADTLGSSLDESSAVKSASSSKKAKGRRS